MAPFYESSGQVNDEAISIAGGRTFQVVQLADSSGAIINPASGIVSGGTTDVNVTNTVDTLTGLSIPEHDHIALTYTGSNLTGVVYKTGGATGTTVATLTLTYDGSNNLTSVTKV